MALTRETKAELLAGYRSDMAAAPHAFLVGFSGITVGQVDDLRRRVRTAGGRYSVVKNRIARLAFEDSGLGVLSDHLVGPTAIAYSDDDPVGLARTLTEFAEDVPVLEFKAGLVDGQQVSAEAIREIANLPSREALVAKLLFLLQSPVARLVRGLGDVTPQFLRALNQVASQKAENRESGG